MQESEDSTVELTIRLSVAEVERILARNLNPQRNESSQESQIASPKLLKQLMDAERRCHELEARLKQIKEYVAMPTSTQLALPSPTHHSPPSPKPGLGLSLSIPPYHYPVSRKRSSPALK